MSTGRRSPPLLAAGRGGLVKTGPCLSRNLRTAAYSAESFPRVVEGVDQVARGFVVGDPHLDGGAADSMRAEPASLRSFFLRLSARAAIVFETGADRAVDAQSVSLFCVEAVTPTRRRVSRGGVDGQ